MVAAHRSAGAAGSNQRATSASPSWRPYLSKSQVSKILSALVDSVCWCRTRDPHPFRRPVLLCARLALHDHDSLCQAATPVMRELLNRTGYSVRAVGADGEQTLYLIGLEGPMFMDTGWHSGNSVFGASPGVGRRADGLHLDPQTTDRSVLLLVPLLTSATRCATGRCWSGWSLMRAAPATACSATKPRLGWASSVPLFKAGQQIVGALSAFLPHHVGADEEVAIHVLHERRPAQLQRLGCSVYPLRRCSPCSGYGARRRDPALNSRPEASAPAPPLLPHDPTTMSLESLTCRTLASASTGLPVAACRAGPDLPQPPIKLLIGFCGRRLRWDPTPAYWRRISRPAWGSWSSPRTALALLAAGHRCGVAQAEPEWLHRCCPPRPPSS